MSGTWPALKARVQRAGGVFDGLRLGVGVLAVAALTYGAYVLARMGFAAFYAPATIHEGPLDLEVAHLAVLTLPVLVAAGLGMLGKDRTYAVRVLLVLAPFAIMAAPLSFCQKWCGETWGPLVAILGAAMSLAVLAFALPRRRHAWVGAVLGALALGTAAFYLVLGLALLPLGLEQDTRYPPYMASAASDLFVVAINLALLVGLVWLACVGVAFLSEFLVSRASRRETRASTEAAIPVDDYYVRGWLDARERDDWRALQARLREERDAVLARAYPLTLQDRHGIALVLASVLTLLITTAAIFVAAGATELCGRDAPCERAYGSVRDLVPAMGSASVAFSAGMFGAGALGLSRAAGQEARLRDELRALALRSREAHDRLIETARANATRQVAQAPRPPQP